MNPFHSIFRNTAVFGFARLVERASTIVLGLLIARTLGASGLGIYSTAVVLYSFISIAADMGSSNFLVREISKNREIAGRYLVHVGAMAALAGAAATTCAWLVLPYLGYSDQLALSAYIVTLAIVPGTLKTVQEAVFVAVQRVEFIAYSSLLAGFVQVALALVLLRQGAGVVAMVALFAGIQCLIALAYFWFLRQYLRGVAWKVDVKFAWGLLRQMRAFIGSSVLAALFARPEILILSLFANEAAIGFYSAAARIVDVWHFIPDTYMTNVFPVLSRAHHKADGSARYVQEKSLKYLLALTMPVTIGTVVLAGPIVAMLYGPGFDVTAQLVPILAWTLPLAAVSSVLWRVLAARGRQGLVFRVQIVTTIVRLSTGVALISMFSEFGAVIVPPVVFVLNVTLLTWCLRREGAPVNLIGPVWRFAAAAGVMGALVYATRDSFGIAAAFILAVASYALAVFLFRAFSPDDVSLVRGLFRRAGTVDGAARQTSQVALSSPETPTG
jgi:O-antigen/teichoic acid export membrane protein